MFSQNDLKFVEIVCLSFSTHLQRVERQVPWFYESAPVKHLIFFKKNLNMTGSFGSTGCDYQLLFIGYSLLRKEGTEDTVFHGLHSVPG